MAGVINCKKAELQKNGYKDLVDWLNASPNHLYIGRDMTVYVKGAVGSKWGNPFGPKSGDIATRLKNYENHVRNSPELFNSLHELEGKVLGCWCVPYGPCHGQTLIKLLNEVKNTQKDKIKATNSNLFNLEQDFPKL